MPTDPEPRQVRVHWPARSLDERQRQRARGVGPGGLPTARSLGIAPRDLIEQNPGLTMRQAFIASAELLKRAHEEIRRPH